MIMAPQQTQFIDSDKLDRVAIWMAWLFGVVAPILISVVGNYVAFDGGTWNDFTSREFSGKVFLFAILWQACSTVAQFAFKARAQHTGLVGWWVAYLLSLMVSVVPSLVAYWALAASRLVAFVEKLGAGYVAYPLVGLLLVVVCGLFDMLPEWIAVAHKQPQTTELEV